MTSSAQKRFLRVFLLVAAIIVLIAVPLILLGDKRLDVAQQLGFAPDVGVEQIAEDEQDIDLLVVPVQVQLRSPRPQIRYHATLISYPSETGRTLQSVDSEKKAELPIANYDLVAASPDGKTVLFREGRENDPGRVFTLDVATFRLGELPAGRIAPDDSDYWNIPITREIANECDGISPNARYITCFGDPKFAAFIAGDYQIDVIVYGQPKQIAHVYRGLGFRPTVGWSADDRWLYFQNERGIWRVEVTDNMFPPNTSAYGNL